MNGIGKLGAPVALWVALVAVNYISDPHRLFKMGVGLDGIRLWMEAPVTLAGLARGLAGECAAFLALGGGLAAAWFAGAGLLRWFNGRAAPLRLALGLAAGSLGMLGIGLTGLFRPWLFVPAALLAAAAGWITRPSRPVQARTPAHAGEDLVPAWVTGLAVALACLSLLLNAFSALAPETGYDSLIQHLGDPRDYLAEGRIRFNDLSFLAQHPAAIEMLYAWLLPFGGDSAARLLHVALGALGAWTFGVWTLKLRTRHDAFLLGSLLYLTPFIGIISARSYVDNGLLFYGAASLLAATGSPLQGVMVGMALGTKYIGGFFLVGWLAALAATGQWRMLLPFLAGTALSAGWWGGRNWLNTGNPVYPFGYGLLGGIGWDDWSASEYSGELGSYGRVAGLAAKPSIPWLAVVHDRGALDDGSLGPFYLMALPLLFLVRGLPMAGRTAGWSAAAVWCLWLFSPRQVRYAVPLLPLLLAALLPALVSARDAWKRTSRATGLLIALFLPIQLLISFEALYVWVNPLYVMGGALSREKYLANIVEPRDPATGSSLYLQEAQRLPGLLWPGSRTYILGDAKKYYMRGDYLVNALFNPPLFARIIRESGKPADVARRLRQRGVTHVLYNIGGSIHIEYTHRMFRWNDRELRLLEDFFSGWMKPIDRLQSSEGDPMYLLFELKPGRHEWPPYLPGVDTRIAFVEQAVNEGRREEGRREVRTLEGRYPSSAYLRRRLARALRGG